LAIVDLERKPNYRFLILEHLTSFAAEGGFARSNHNRSQFVDFRQQPCYSRLADDICLNQQF
jgi:hypothetical protein